MWKNGKRHKFRIYAAIYSKANPNRAIEILQHIENIKDAAVKNTWSSVYEYNKIFRNVMETFPGRNWAIITDVWIKVMEAKTPFNTPSQSSSMSNSGFGNLNELRHRSSKTELCFKFNNGKCPHQNCKFEHKCSKCFQTNHGFSHCRWNKRNKDKISPAKETDG